MKCVVANRHVRLFGRAIHCLSRIGDELFLEALKDGLALRTVNSSRSAYACFVFKESFFTEYEQGCHEIDSTNPAEQLKCKISMKSVLAIFKSLGTIEKTVEHCMIEFKPTECRLIFTLYCKHGITKTHNLTYQECESLQAVFAKELCPNLIQTQAKVLQDTVCNFPNSCEEISLKVSPDSVKVKNYIDDEPDPLKVVHTEMTLVPEEFDNFQIGIDTSVTFCLKELRAVLSFSEFACQPISLHFEHSGKPIVFALDSDPMYGADFVMATLAESDMATQQETTVTASASSVVNQPTSSKHNKMNGRKVQESSSDQRVPKRFKPNTANTKIISNSKITDSSSKLNASSRATSQRVPCIEKADSIRDDFFSPTFPYENVMADIVTAPVGQKGSNTETRSLDSTQAKLNSSMLKNNTNRTNEVNDRFIQSILEDDDDILMGTPPTSPPVGKSAKKKAFFSDFYSPKKVEKTILLAADTDDEDDD